MKQIINVLMLATLLFAASCSDKNQGQTLVYNIQTKAVHPVTATTDAKGESVLKVAYEDGEFRLATFKAADPKMEERLPGIVIPEGYILYLTIIQAANKTDCDTIASYTIIKP